MLLAYSGVILGSLLTLLVSILILIIAPPYRILSYWRPMWQMRNPFHFMVKAWAVLLDTIVFRILVRVRVIVEGNIGQLEEEEVVLWIGNHPSTMATASVARVISYFTSDVIFIAKHDLNLFMRWPIMAIGSGAIFINRGDHSSWQKALTSALSGRAEPIRSIVIFPDTHRATKKRLCDEREKFSQTIPSISDWLTHTLVPRSGGLFALLTCLRAKKIRIMNITCGYDCEERGVIDAPNIYKGTLRIMLEDVTPFIPRDNEEELRTWLIAEWQKKNERIRSWQPKKHHAMYLTDFDKCGCPCSSHANEDPNHKH